MSVGNGLWDFESHTVEWRHRTHFELLTGWLTENKLGATKLGGFLMTSRLTTAGCTLDLVKVKRFKTDFVLLFPNFPCVEFLHQATVM